MNLDSFVRDNSQVLTPPLVPEIRLHLASEVIPLWRKTEEELAEIGVPPPYWAFAWAGGQALARYLLDNPAAVSGKRVLDFGSGSGLVAIAAAMAGAAHVIAADIDVFAIAAIARNADANNVKIQTVAEDIIGTSDRFDLIAIGDMCYERPLAERLMAWLSGAEADVLIGDPGRSYFPKTGLVQLATYSVPTTRELEDREIRQTGVWHVKRDRD
jgi:predicted nicotinamide N-methyase